MCARHTDPPIRLMLMCSAAAGDMPHLDLSKEVFKSVRRPSVDLLTCAVTGLIYPRLQGSQTPTTGPARQGSRALRSSAVRHHLRGHPVSQTSGRVLVVCICLQRGGQIDVDKLFITLLTKPSWMHGFITLS